MDIFATIFKVLVVTLLCGAIYTVLQENKTQERALGILNSFGSSYESKRDIIKDLKGSGQAELLDKIDEDMRSIWGDNYSQCFNYDIYNNTPTFYSSRFFTAYSLLLSQRGMLPPYDKEQFQVGKFCFSFDDVYSCRMFKTCLAIERNIQRAHPNNIQDLSFELVRVPNSASLSGYSSYIVWAFDRACQFGRIEPAHIIPIKDIKIGSSINNHSA